MSFEGSQRWAKFNAILCWAIAVGILGVQIVVVLYPDAMVIRQAFPEWPTDTEDQAYLRGVAIADVIFLQPLLAFTGLGLWQMRRWGLLSGLAVAGAAIYFGILQVAAELLSGSEYHLYGMGMFATPFRGSLVYELTKWVGLLGWVIYPRLLGLYCARKLQQS